MNHSNGFSIVSKYKLPHVLDNPYVYIDHRLNSESIAPHKFFTKWMDVV